MKKTCVSIGLFILTQIIVWFGHYLSGAPFALGVALVSTYWVGICLGVVMSAVSLLIIE